MNEFNEMKDLEVMTFRRNILEVCKKSVEERNSHGPHGQARYVYPPDIHSSSELPPHIRQRVENGTSLSAADTQSYCQVSVGLCRLKRSDLSANVSIFLQSSHM